MSAAFFVVASLSGFGFLVATLILLVGSGLPLWLLLTTRYIVSNETLLVRSGPFAWAIPVSSIKTVRDSSSPITSPALSLDRLELVYSDKKTLLISPKDKHEFRKAIDCLAG